MSLGDFDFGAALLMDHEVNILFWFTWVIVAFITCIIFLNFIIAEASASYERVSGKLGQYLHFSKVSLINESEDMMPMEWKQNPKYFPKYLIIREKYE